MNQNDTINFLPPDYSSTDFAPLALLEQGEVDMWLRRRSAILLDKAKDTALECEAGKLSTLAVIVASAVMSSNPLAWIPLIIGSGGYLYTIFQERHDVGSFKPIPMYRGSLLNLFQAMEGSRSEPQHPFIESIAYLPEIEKDEAILINGCFAQISKLLSSAPPKVRFDLYRYACIQFHIHPEKQLISQQDVNEYVSSAVSEARRTVGISPKASQETLPPPKEPTSTTVALDSAQNPKMIASSTVVQPPTPINQTLPPFDRDRVINESKGLMIIGDSGSAKTCIAQFIAHGFDGHGIIIFDPHGKTDWGDAYVITKMGAIYRQMAILLELLENGDESPLLVIADEWLEIRGDRRNKKGSEYAGLADDFIRLFSTKPREFNKLAAFVLHSPNVKAAGVDSFLRENYLKVYLGRLAKKEFPHTTDCAYPCVLEDEQQEHPTHGHHTEFKPKGKAPSNLQPLQSAPINIPLAFMDGSEVKVCDRGWSDGQLRLEVENIRQRLEMLFDGSTPEPNSEPSEPTVQNPEPLNLGSEPLNQPIDEGSDDLRDGSQFSSEPGSGRFTPLNLSKEQVLTLIENLNHELNQTQIIERLWQVKKGGSAAWKEAREQFRQLTGD